MLVPIHTDITQKTSVNWIIRLMLSLLWWPKVILLSGLMEIVFSHSILVCALFKWFSWSYYNQVSYFLCHFDHFVASSQFSGFLNKNLAHAKTSIALQKQWHYFMLQNTVNCIVISDVATGQFFSDLIAVTSAMHPWKISATTWNVTPVMFMAIVLKS